MSRPAAQPRPRRPERSGEPREPAQRERRCHQAQQQRQAGDVLGDLPGLGAQSDRGPDVVVDVVELVRRSRRCRRCRPASRARVASVSLSTGTGIELALELDGAALRCRRRSWRRARRPPARRRPPPRACDRWCWSRPRGARRSPGTFVAPAWAAVARDLVQRGEHALPDGRARGQRQVLQRRLHLRAVRGRASRARTVWPEKVTRPTLKPFGRPVDEAAWPRRRRPRAGWGRRRWPASRWRRRWPRSRWRSCGARARRPRAGPRPGRQGTNASSSRAAGRWRRQPGRRGTSRSSIGSEANRDGVPAAAPLLRARRPPPAGATGTSSRSHQGDRKLIARPVGGGGPCSAGARSGRGHRTQSRSVRSTTCPAPAARTASATAAR